MFLRGRWLSCIFQEDPVRTTLYSRPKTLWTSRFRNQLWSNCWINHYPKMTPSMDVCLFSQFCLDVHAPKARPRRPRRRHAASWKAWVLHALKSWAIQSRWHLLIFWLKAKGEYIGADYTKFDVLLQLVTFTSIPIFKWRRCKWWHRTTVPRHVVVLWR